MTTEPYGVNLADIIGSADPGDHRVASFQLGGDTLTIWEQCDSNFAIDLNAEQVARLIAWLADAHQQMTRQETT